MSIEKIKEILTNKDNIKTVGIEVNNCFYSNADASNLESEFSLKQGVMVSKETNTIFKFSPEPESLTGKLFTMIREEDEKGNLDEETFDLIENFFNRDVVEFLNSQDTSFNYSSKIRRVILNNADEIIFPISNVKVTYLEVNPLFDGSGGYTLVVQKYITKDEAESGVAQKSIVRELIDTHIATGQSYEDIIEQKKQEGDDAYKYVAGVIKRYYEASCALGLFVDYNPTPKEELKEKLELAQKELDEKNAK